MAYSQLTTEGGISTQIKTLCRIPTPARTVSEPKVELCEGGPSWGCQRMTVLQGAIRTAAGMNLQI